MQDTMLRCS